MNVDDLLELRPLIGIAHHAPGRIRLKLDPEIRDHPKAALLDLIGALDRGPVRVRLNVLARSLVVEYDPAVITPNLWTELLDQADADRVRHAAESLARLLGVTPTP